MLPPERRLDAALIMLATLGSGGLSLLLGQDFNTDQLHYHFYLGWSLVTGRLDHDIAPAGIGTYLNPVLHVPTYLGIAYLPPRVFGFLLGALHGFNAFLAYRLAAHVLEGRRWKQGLAAAAGLVAMVGPSALGLVGTTFGDNLASVPALAALLLLVGGAAAKGASRASGPRGVLVGALAGFATGLKLTFAVFHVALAVAVAALALRTRNVRLVLAFTLGSILAGLASGGYWALQLWERFGNPVFPMANTVFRSPYHEAARLRDARWQARGWQDVWVAPMDMAVGKTSRFQEAPFRDPRYLVLLAVTMGAVIRGLLRKRLAGPRGSLASILVLVYWWTAYVVWLSVFCYYRYFALGEFLAPVAIIASLTLLAAPRCLAPTWLTLAAAIALGSTVPNWGRIRWSDSWYRVRLPKTAEARDAVVIVDATRVSFVLPAFPRGTRFFGLAQLGGLRPLIIKELRAHTGPIFRLTRFDEPPSKLEPLGLSDPGDCETVRTRGNRLGLCRLVRTASSRPSPERGPASRQP
jgi:hypothetical protein